MHQILNLLFLSFPNFQSEYNSLSTDEQYEDYSNNEDDDNNPHSDEEEDKDDEGTIAKRRRTQ